MDNKYNTIGYPKVKKTLEELQKEINYQIENKDYSRDYLLREFSKREGVRQVYLCLVSVYPARAHHIYKISKFTDKKSIHRALHGLRKLGIVDRIPVFNILTKKGRRTGEEGKIVKDFKNWTSKMDDSMKLKFQSVTCYWTLTEKGKDTELITSALLIERGATQNV